MSDLIERLREDHNSIWQPLMDEAAAEIASLRAVIAKAERALEPFDYWEVLGEGADDYGNDEPAVVTSGRVTSHALVLRHFRRATDALASIAGLDAKQEGNGQCETCGGALNEGWQCNNCGTHQPAQQEEPTDE